MKCKQMACISVKCDIECKRADGTVKDLEMFDIGTWLSATEH